MLPHLPQNMDVLHPDSLVTAAPQFQHADATILPVGAPTENAEACCAPSKRASLSAMGGALRTNEAMTARRRACLPATHLTASCTAASSDVSSRPHIPRSLRRQTKWVQHFKAEPRQRQALLRHMCMTTSTAREAHKGRPEASTRAPFRTRMSYHCPAQHSGRY